MGCATPSNASKDASLATKPSVSGAAAMDAEPNKPTAVRYGISDQSPLSFPISRVFFAESMAPMTRKSDDLYRAWATKRANPGPRSAGMPEPTMANMRPSWLTVP